MLRKFKQLFLLYVVLSVWFIGAYSLNFKYNPRRLQEGEANSDNGNSEENSQNGNNDQNNQNETDNTQNLEDILPLNISFDNKTQILARPCQRYEIFLNYSAFSIEVEKKESGHHKVSKMIVTDVELPSSICDVSTFTYCNHTAKMCLTRNFTKDDDEDVEIKINSCFPRAYVYIYINETNFTGNKYGNLKIKQKKSECDYANATEWEYCLGIPETQCKSDDTSTCDAKCKWIGCTYKNRKKNIVESTVTNCVPFTTMRDADICEDFFQDDNDDLHDDQTIFDFKYCGHAMNFEIMHPKKYSLSSILLFILVILLVLFILSICWYRWKITNHKQAPFTPPSCCPDWVYPRIQADDYRQALNE